MKSLSEFLIESLTTSEIVKHICKELKSNKRLVEDEVWSAVLKFKKEHPGQPFRYTVSPTTNSDEKDTINGYCLYLMIGDESWFWKSSSKSFEKHK